MGFRSWLLRGERWHSEQRSITSLPWTENTPFNVGGTLPLPSPTASQEMALSVAPVYAANRLLASSVSTLPIEPFRRVGPNATARLSNLPQLFQQLRTDGRLVSWLCQCVSSLNMRGNAYGLIIQRDGFQYPTVIEWMHPDRVRPDERPDHKGDWLYNGREVPHEDVVHIPLFALAGKHCALSPISAFARTLGVAIQSQEYASGWFGAGGFPPGTFKNNQKIVNETDSDAIRARLSSAIRSRQPLVYGSDWDYNSITVPPEEAQFVQTYKLTATDIASVYGIYPPELIGGESGNSMTYANVEQQQINFTMFTLRPYLVLLEEKFSSLLPDRQYVKFNADALVRADLETRWTVNQIRYNMGAASIDEIREQEDQPPLPNGQGKTYGPQAVQQPPQQPQIDSGDGDVPPIRRIQ